MGIYETHFIGRRIPSYASVVRSSITSNSRSVTNVTGKNIQTKIVRFKSTLTLQSHEWTGLMKCRAKAMELRSSRCVEFCSSSKNEHFKSSMFKWKFCYRLWAVTFNRQVQQLKNIKT